MSKPAVRDRTKLPRWAQSEIEKLEADVAFYKRQIIEMEGTDVRRKTDTHVGDFVDGDRPLRRGARILFTLDHFKGEPLKVEARIVDPGDGVPVLDVRAGHGTISIKPRASNSVWVTVVEP